MENQLQNQLSLVETLALNRVDERLSGSRSALARQPQLAPTRYEIVTRWEERIGNNVRRTIISKQLTVSSVPDGNDCLVTLEMTPPEIRPVDLTTLEEVVVRLSTLYQRLLLRVSATGQLLALLNHAEIVHTWATIKQELASSCLMVAQVCTISAWFSSASSWPVADTRSSSRWYSVLSRTTTSSNVVRSTGRISGGVISSVTRQSLPSGTLLTVSCLLIMVRRTLFPIRSSQRVTIS